MKSVTKAFLRYLPRRRALTALQLLGIAIGVASAVGMALSARAALSSFRRAVAFVQGEATHRLTRPAGPLEEGVLRAILDDPAVRAFSPVVDRRVELSSGEWVRLLGVDPFLDRAFRPYLAPPEGEEAGLRFLLEERAVWADESVARRAGAAPGGTIDTARGRLEVLGTFPNPSGEPLLVLDIGHAQELLGLRGRVDRVDLILTDPEGFAARWRPGFVVRSVAERRAGLSDMLRAFRLNLEALSLLGLFVGVFLVYNTATFAVASRRRDAGILLSLGAGRREVAGAFLVELAILGGLGGLGGAALGYGIARSLTGLVGGAITNLYFFLQPTPPSWSGAVAAAGAALGWGACFLGGGFPLLDLARTDPVEALRGRGARRSSRERARQAAWAGAGVAAVSLALFPPASIHVYAGFAGAFGLLLGCSLASGAALDALGPAIGVACRAAAGLPGKVAAGSIRRNLGRTAVAVAAFMVALSMSVGIGLMIGSFRSTLVWWMDSQLRGELYVGRVGRVEVPTEFYEELRRLPGIGGIDPYRNVQVLYRGTPVYVASVDAAVLQRYTAFGWKEGDGSAWDAVRRGAVIVSESFSRRFGLGRGDTVALEGVEGPEALPVAGVFYDYTTEHGLVMMDRATYLRVFRDETLDSLGIFFDPGTAERDKARVVEEVRRRARDRGLPVSSRAELTGDILEVFDSTFAVTRSMRVLAVVVAFFGIAGALLTLYMERQREFGIYRALGFSTAQVAAMTLLEGLGMGLAAFVLSVPVGTALAFVLIGVINLRSFHWTVFFSFAWGPYLVALVTAAAASVGAALYPVWRVWRTFPHVQLREE
ncbi:MAG: FtsX-like permease family protein [Deferrisomatales bacterium]